MMWRPWADHGQKHGSGGETALGDLTSDGPLQKHYSCRLNAPPVPEQVGFFMSGVSVETLLDLWSAGLRELKARVRPLFARPSVADSAAAFLDGLLGAERRKTGWMRAEAAGDAGPWRQQAVLGRSHWDAEALRRAPTIPRHRGQDPKLSDRRVPPLRPQQGARRHRPSPLLPARLYRPAG